LKKTEIAMFFDPKAQDDVFGKGRSGKKKT